MGELRFIVEVRGLDRVLYEEPAHWEKCLLSVVDISTIQVELWERGVDDPQALESAAVLIKQRLRRLLLALGWAYGRELQVRVIKVIAPSYDYHTDHAEIAESIAFGAKAYSEVPPKKAPQQMPEVPLEAERWVVMWVEANKLGDYVEEQLRRHYLIIEELWDEFQNSFAAAAHSDKERVKLVRDFVSHASCRNAHVIALVEPDLPSAVVTVNGKKRVSFARTVEHRNFVSRFEVVARDLARSLAVMKMQQFGRVVAV